MINEVRQSAEQKMHKTLEAFRLDLTKVRTGRAHTGLFDHLMVDYYGTQTPLNQVASVTLIDARTLGVQPWEKTLFAKVEKAIRDSDLGLNPAASGEIIRVSMPMLTEERRRDLIKVVRAEAENTRVSVRNVRRDSNHEYKTLLKDKVITEDEERRGQDDIQKLTDKFIADIDKLLQAKESELMSI